MWYQCIITLIDSAIPYCKYILSGYNLHMTTLLINRCKGCLGKKKLLGLGGMMKDCQACKGIGYIESHLDKPTAVIAPAIAPMRKTIIDMTKPKRGRPQQKPLIDLTVSKVIDNK